MVESIARVAPLHGDAGRRAGGRAAAGRLLHQPRGAACCRYEQAQTRRVPRRTGWYNLSTHFPWIGMRTASSAARTSSTSAASATRSRSRSAPAMTRETLVHLLDTLDPEHEAGPAHPHPPVRRARHRAAAAAADRGGAGRPPHRAVVLRSDARQHRRRRASGVKTRRFDDILSELEWAFDIHASHGSYLGGVHFELTGEDVTECVGGARGLTEVDLDRDYRSQVDPAPQLRAGARDGAAGRTQDGQPGGPGGPRLAPGMVSTIPSARHVVGAEDGAAPGMVSTIPSARQVLGAEDGA